MSVCERDRAWVREREKEGERERVCVCVGGGVVVRALTEGVSLSKACRGFSQGYGRELKQRARGFR